MLLTCILATIAYCVGVAIQRRYRDDPVACMFADALIALVAIPISHIKAKLKQLQQPPAAAIAAEPADKPNGRTKIKTAE